MEKLDPQLAHHYLDGLLDAMAQGVVFIQTDGKVRLINREAEELLGVCREEMCGKSHKTLLGDLGLEEYLKAPLPPITLYPTLNGTELEVSVRTAHIEGKMRGVALLLRDLKEAGRRAETTLIRCRSGRFPIVAESQKMQTILTAAKEIAASHASCLVTGESGTGKEVIAQLIHGASPRRDRAFIPTNCAAIPDNLVESEYFGHERGAFTGASQKRIGRFEQAHGGTLLLDEITEFPLHLQPKLLRALQEQTFERVGGNKSIQVDVRLIATSNRPIEETLKASLREDLYYRLSVIHLHIPPLRERRDDILPLAKAYLERFCLENGRQKKTLSPEAEEALLTHRWPGNVRELANAMERACVLKTPDTLAAKHFTFSS